MWKKIKEFFLKIDKKLENIRNSRFAPKFNMDYCNNNYMKRRFFSMIIDNVFALAIFFFMFLICCMNVNMLEKGAPSQFIKISLILCAFCTFFVFYISIWLQGKTFGMQICGIKFEFEKKKKLAPLYIIFTSLWFFIEICATTFLIFYIDFYNKTAEELATYVTHSTTIVVYSLFMVIYLFYICVGLLFYMSNKILFHDILAGSRVIKD